MEAFMTSIYDMIVKYQPAVVVLAIGVIAGAGIRCMVGEESRQKAKKDFPWIVIGTGLVLGCVVLGKELASSFVF